MLLDLSAIVRKPPAMRFLLLLLAVAACEPFDVCDVIVETPLPQQLSATGIDDPDVRPYTPSFALWSDGAEKRRWLYLPPGAVIDTTDPDEWQFPIGTKAWKEFTRDGVRVETRLFQRLDDGWAGVAYAWAADQRDAYALPAGDANANGTPHDIPSAGDCEGCHGGRHSHLLGVSAIQLAHAPAPGELALDELVSGGRLSGPPPTPLVPGEPAVRTALGYLHANCSHCHNQTRPARTGARCYDPDNDLDFALRLDALSSPEDTAASRTAKDHHERMLELMGRRGSDLHMPPLATEQVDAEGLATVRTWIGTL